jgi:hypothetical protein
MSVLKSIEICGALASSGSLNEWNNAQCLSNKSLQREVFKQNKNFKGQN